MAVAHKHIILDYLHALELLHAGVHDLQGGVVLAVRDGALALPWCGV